MAKGLIASAATTIDAPKARVWDALVDRAALKQYMFGADVISDFREGSPIVWRGEWKGRPYEDKGTVLRARPSETLVYTHYSPLTGKPDVPDSYHTVTITLSDDGPRTRISLVQDGNENEESKGHSEQNWNTMLGGLKKYVEAPR
jgi:uncharacterized protein YndB with AHSA1/START domain